MWEFIGFYCFFLQLDNIQGVCDELLAYDVLQKRRAMIDAFADGLEVLLVSSASRAYPGLFAPLFVSLGQCRPQDILDILQFSNGPLDGSAKRISDYLKRFIQSLKEAGD